MAVILNASTSTGFVQSADTSGVLTLQSNGTNAASVSGSNLQFNSGYGSVATAYGCRAWVNFNGTGTVAIRGSGNVSSITDNGTGDYTVNFTTAMPDTNYCPTFGYGQSTASSGTKFCVLTTTNEGATPTLASTTQLRVFAGGTGVAYDFGYLQVAIFR